MRSESNPRTLRCDGPDRQSPGNTGDFRDSSESERDWRRRFRVTIWQEQKRPCRVRHDPNCISRIPRPDRGGSQRPRLPWGNPTVLSGAAVGHDRVRDGTGWGHRALGHEPPGSGRGMRIWVGRGGGVSRGGTRQGWVKGQALKEKTVLGHEHDSAPVGYPPSTCRLATGSSARGLTLVTDGDTRLEEGFPLRCFQRFARPNVATQRCRLPDNWSTSGSSSPVLSY